MPSVTVVFKNGNIVNFAAQELDLDLTENRGLLNKYAYRDAQGKDSFIYLEPNDVVGVFLTEAPGRSEHAVAYKVPGA
jgi:hypothetical protein